VDLQQQDVNKGIDTIIETARKLVR